MPKEVEIKVDHTITQRNIDQTKKVLIDNGIEEDEVEVVLQAIGYTLLDVELFSEENT